MKNLIKVGLLAGFLFMAMTVLSYAQDTLSTSQAASTVSATQGSTTDVKAKDKKVRKHGKKPVKPHHKKGEKNDKKDKEQK